MKNIEEMKSYIKDIGKSRMVKELVEGGWETEDAVEWVYDMNTLSKSDFSAKHFGK